MRLAASWTDSYPVAEFWFIWSDKLGFPKCPTLYITLSLIVIAPDIKLTKGEAELLAQIKFCSTYQDDIRASIMPMVALSESLLKRGAIPEVRLLYFTDRERNPGGRGRSRQQIFEKNGTSGAEILAHPHFMKYLKYFVYGPALPAEVIAKFKNAASFSGYLSGGDVNDLASEARAAVRSARLDPHTAADEFHKLVLECGAVASSAESIRKLVRAVRFAN